MQRLILCWQNEVGIYSTLQFTNTIKNMQEKRTSKSLWTKECMPELAQNYTEWTYFRTEAPNAYKIAYAHVWRKDVYDIIVTKQIIIQRKDVTWKQWNTTIKRISRLIPLFITCGSIITNTWRRFVVTWQGPLSLLVIGPRLDVLGKPSDSRVKAIPEKNVQAFLILHGEMVG